jgi:hypothetical protein
MQDGTHKKSARGNKPQPTENINMKFILSFIVASAILSAGPSSKLSLGNAALTQETLCAPTNIFTPSTPIKCSPAAPVATTPTIKCDLPVVAQASAPNCDKVTTAPVICPTPKTPVIECPKDPTPVTPKVPTSATPEPASYALLGFGLVTAGVARRFRSNK